MLLALSSSTAVDTDDTAAASMTGTPFGNPRSKSPALLMRNVCSMHQSLPTSVESPEALSASDRRDAETWG